MPGHLCAHGRTIPPSTSSIRRRRPLALSLTALLIAVPAAAQTHRGSIRGVVLDPSGAAVPQARVLVVNEATGDSRSHTAGDEGRFAVAELPAGVYRIEIEQAGHKKSVVQIALEVGQELWVDVPLELGNVTEEVRVAAEALALERESAALGTRIDARQLSGLPLDGRNFLELSLLAAGTAPAPEGSASSLRGDFAFTANGGREDAQSFVLDGVYNIDPKLNTPGVRPPVDGIREFEVLTSTYDASFGRNAAGQVNVITQSGTNRLRGTAYGFFRSKALDSRNVFAPADEEAPDYSRQQFGGSIGGPITENRTFFFADYERTRLREGITRVTNVPTLAERNGDFSNSLRRPPINPLTGQPFPGHRIPVFFQNPVGRAIADLYPLPNRETPFANFVSSPTLEDDSDQFDAKVDHTFANGSTLSTRYSFSDRRFFEPFASTVSVPGFGTDVPRRAQNLGAALTQPFGGTLINEVRVGYSRVAIGVFHENQGTSLNQRVGLPELSSNPRDFGLSQITISGYSPLGDEFTTPQESATDMYQVLDAVTWARGAHLVKAGAELRHVRQSAYRDVQSRGFLNFADVYITGNALADLLLGFPLVTGGAILDNPQELRSSAWSAFVQDNWRLRPDLTLSAGLRYEYIAPAVDADDRANLYDVATGELVPVGTSGMPRGGYEGDRNNLAPRVGFAWTPDAAGRLAIRGGYGLYYNQGALATGEGLYFNPPYFDLNLFVPFPGVPPVTLQDPFPASYPIALPVSATAYQRDLQTGWLEHWNVSAQRQIGDSRAVEIAYVGSRGHDLIAARDINQPAPSPQVPNLRPNPLFDDITLIESRGSSDYHALQLKFQQRLDRGLSFLSSYTLGRSEDDASGFFASTGDPNFPQDSRNPDAEHGRSSFDVRHRFSLSFAWQLPFGPGRHWLSRSSALSAILADMELQGIVTLQSGRPFTVALLPEIDNSNTGRSTLGFGANDRPNVTGDAALDNPTTDRWFDTSKFTLPPFGSFGNAGRNILEGPGYSNVNLALLKFMSIGTTRLELRAEAFNLLNSANFNLPDAFLGSPTFGRIVSADSPRRCQFGVRVSF
jgi:hypothetical protein